MSKCIFITFPIDCANNNFLAKILKFWSIAQIDYFGEKIRLRPSSEKMFFSPRLTKNPGDFFFFGLTKIRCGGKKNNREKITFFVPNLLYSVKSISLTQQFYPNFGYDDQEVIAQLFSKLGLNRLVTSKKSFCTHSWRNIFTRGKMLFSPRQVISHTMSLIFSLIDEIWKSQFSTYAEWHN